MKYILKTEKNENGNEVFSKEKKDGKFIYLAKDENGNCGVVDKNWILANQNNIVNLGVGKDNSIYVVKAQQTQNLSEGQKVFFKDSQIRDKMGNLLVCYHATNNKFEAFDKNCIKKYPGFWFSESKEYAKQHGKYVLPVYLNIKNPLNIDNPKHDEFMWKWVDKNYGEVQDDYFIYTKEFRDFLIKNNFDGFMFNHHGFYTIVALEPNQIKVVTNLNPTNANSLQDKVKKIEDFGEKIGGAKKDLWKQCGLSLTDVSRLNVLERKKYITKTNVWPEPDYQALFDSKEYSRAALYFIKAVRSSLPNKPGVKEWDENKPDVVEETQKGYIYVLSTLKDRLMMVKTDSDIDAVTLDTLIDFDMLKRRGYYTVEDGPKAFGCMTNSLIKVIQMKSKDANNSATSSHFLMSNEEIQSERYSNFKVKQIDGVDVILEEQRAAKCVRMRLADRTGWEFLYVYKDGNKEDIMGLRPKDADMYDGLVNGSWFVYNDKAKEIVGTGLDSEERAKWYAYGFAKSYYELCDAVDMLAKAKKKADAAAKKKKTYTPPQLENLEGRSYRNNKDVVGQDYLNVFGFRGGEFGNWMNEADRRLSMNYGYDALKDLAEVLDIPDTDISLGGKLAIAFGARGSGKALAHFEPLSNVINLTKMKGAGNLAHEWGHALDYYLGSCYGISGCLSEKINGVKDADYIQNVVNAILKKKGFSDIAPLEDRYERYAESVRVIIKRDVIKMMDQYGRAVENCVVSEHLDEANELIEKIINDTSIGDLASIHYKQTGEGAESVENLKVFLQRCRMEKGLQKGVGIRKDDYIKLLEYQALVNSYREKISKAKAEQSDISTNFKKNGEALDLEYAKNDGYWGSVVELFARAFEAYIKDKLGRKSDYLVGHTDFLKKAYPQGEERQAINKAFDEMFIDLKKRGLLKNR